MMQRRLGDVPQAAGGPGRRLDRPQGSDAARDRNGGRPSNAAARRARVERCSVEQRRTGPEQSDAEWWGAGSIQRQNGTSAEEQATGKK